MHWRDFERVLARLLEEFGYEIDLQRGTKDGGVDLFALRRAGHPLGPHKYLLQAKRWKGSVGVAPVRELKFLHDQYGMTKSCCNRP
jgi:restriction system protein